MAQLETVRRAAPDSDVFQGDVLCSIRQREREFFYGRNGLREVDGTDQEDRVRYIEQPYVPGLSTLHRCRFLERGGLLLDDEPGVVKVHRKP